MILMSYFNDSIRTQETNYKKSSLKMKKVKKMRRP